MIESESLFLFPRHLVSCHDGTYHEYRNDLIESCYLERELDPKGASYSNVNGWQSEPTLEKEGTYWDIFFNQKITTLLKHCCKNELKLKDTSKVELIRWWVNISGKNSYNVMHTHPMCHYSAIFYVKCTENSAHVRFHQRNADHLTNDAREDNFLDKHKMHQQYNFSPSEGTLLLFPSALEHDVTLQEIDEDRISISFDINIWP